MLTKSELSNAKEIARGGEGVIYEHPQSKSHVVKVYHQPRPAVFGEHLKYLHHNLPANFVKPEDIILDGGKVIGYTMPYVNFNDYWLFNNLFNKGFCNTNGIDKAFKINVLKDLRTSMESIHKIDIVVGDLNQYNLFVSKKGEILFVDCDSYASKFNVHSGVLLDEIRDWTTLNINRETDSWSYDVLSFWATTFCHPFKWVLPGNAESLELRVKTGKSFLSRIPGIKIPPLYEAPDGIVEQQYREVFGGRRYMINFDGIQVAAPIVIKQQVHSTSLNIRELFSDVIDVLASKTQLAIKKDKWILISAGISGIIKQLKEIECDILFPGVQKFAYCIGKELYNADGFIEKRFSQPEYYFVDGSLSVIDYIRDVQYNFNLSNQLVSIDNSQIQVFAKSITVRDSAIQNFGGSKFVNIPIRNTYSLIPVPKGTKNAYYTNGFLTIESKEKSTIKYLLTEANSKNQIELEYLPYIAVREKLVFVPENGRIDVYKDFTIVTQLDVSVCTRNSKLFHTDAGIILFENKTVYLLNTKK